MKYHNKLLWDITLLVQNPLRILVSLGLVMPNPAINAGAMEGLPLAVGLCFRKDISRARSLDGAVYLCY